MRQIRSLLRSALAGTCLICAPAAAQQAADAAIHLLRPLGLAESQAMDFGRIGPSNTAGTVVLDAATDARSATGGVTLLAGGGEAAEFVGISSGFFRFLVFRYPTQILLTRQGGTETMMVTQVTPAPGGGWASGTPGVMYRITFGNRVVTVRLGGTLQVGASQPPGIYTGTYDVSLDYN